MAHNRYLEGLRIRLVAAKNTGLMDVNMSRKNGFRRALFDLKDTIS